MNMSMLYRALVLGVFAAGAAVSAMAWANVRSVRLSGCSGSCIDGCSKGGANCSCIGSPGETHCAIVTR